MESQILAGPRYLILGMSGVFVACGAMILGPQHKIPGGGNLLACPICFDARKLDQGELVANAQLGGATPLWEWIGDDGATVFSY